MAFSVPLHHFLLCIASLFIIKSEGFKITSLANLDPLTQFNLSIQATKNDLLVASTMFAKHGAVTQAFPGNVTDERVQSALQSCRELIDLAQFHVDMVIPTNDSLANVEMRDDFKRWLCSAGSFLDFCKEEFSYSSDEVKRVVSEHLDKSTKAADNSLTIISGIDDQMQLSPYEDRSMEQASDWPSWLSNEDRILLNSHEKVAPNLVVAKDGSGNYRTISDALKAVPSFSKKRFSIYVKGGVYLENPRVTKDKRNVFMYGDGPHKTIISTSRSNATKFSINQSAALTVEGNRFIAVNIGFQNTAGPAGGPAVALRSVADMSAFYRCKFDGYQDTLFASTNRQFYRECSISGTIDFIFGDAAVVIQKSDIFARKPLHGQGNVITASFRQRSTCPSSISIHDCHVQTIETLSGVQTYLGRPLRDNARIAFMESRLEGLVDPQGWYLKDGHASSICLAEYDNRGPGAGTGQRIQVEGVIRNMSHDEATKFTVRSLIGGSQWLPGTGIPYNIDLING